MTWTGAMFWSYTVRGWCGLFAHLPDGRAMLRHELTWITTSPERAAAELATLLRRREITLQSLLAQPEIFPKPGMYGETVSETFGRAGLPMWRGYNDAPAGYQRLRSWLALVDGRPMLTIHRSCRHAIRTLPTLVSDPSNPDDILLTSDAYPAKAMGFWALSRPTAALLDEPELPEGAIGHDVRKAREELMWGRS